MELIKSLYRILTHPLNKTHKFRTIFRLIWWKTNQLTLRLPAIVQLTPEAKCICYPESSFGSQIIYTQLPEYYEMLFVQKVFNSEDVFVDVGAGLGDYSLIAASKITKGRIFAFEPDPVAFSYIRENVALNNFWDRIFISAKIVSDKNGYEKFTTNKISELSHISTGKPKKESLLEISSITLDKFFNKKGGRIKIIKIDVEGAELKVLQGAKNLLKKRLIDYLIIEINFRNALYGGSSSQIFAHLRKHKYALYFFDDIHKLAPVNKKNQPRKKVYNILAVRKTTKTLRRVRTFISTQ